MKSSRRDFLAMITAASGAFVAPKGMYAALSPDRKLRIGVVSDVHITGVNGELWKWRKALEHFRDVKVDCVVVAGDIANEGLVVELESFAKVWHEIFPGGKRPDGEKVEHVFVMGNHDQAEWRHRSEEAYAKKGEDGAPMKDKDGKFIIDEDDFRSKHIYWTRDTLWKRLFGEEYSHFFAKNIKGYWFLGSHWRCGGIGGKHEYEAVELPGYLSSHASELGKTKPFFFVQHLHPKNTCHGNEAWWPDCGKNTTEVLKDFPNAVCFSGHSHKPLTDERAVWQGGFTSFGTCSLSYSSPLKKNLNGGWAVTPEGVPDIRSSHCNTGYVVDVHEGFLAVRRMELTKNKSIGEDWIVPVPVNPAAPEFAFAPRAKAKFPPAYAKQPKVEIKPVKVKKWDGSVEDKVQVSFPAVEQGDKAFSRVYAYEITMRKKDGTSTVVKTVRSAGCDTSLSLEPERVCWNLNPDTEYIKDCDFNIVPLDCFRKRPKRSRPCIALFGGTSVSSPLSLAAKKIWSSELGVDIDSFALNESKFEPVAKGKPRIDEHLAMPFAAGKKYDAYVIWADTEDVSVKEKLLKKVLSGAIGKIMRVDENAKIFVLTPLASPLDAQLCKNAISFSKVCEQLCKSKKVSCLNQMSSLNLRNSSAAKYFSQGSLLSENGYTLVAPMQVKFLKDGIKKS